MSELISWISFLLCTAFLPFLTVGCIRKVKARFQDRQGASIFQPLLDFIKLARKEQVVSETTTWIFPINSALSVAVMLLVASMVPWLSFKPAIPGDDLFFVLYVLALIRFTAILSALDAGSPFGAFGSSREAYLGMLVEPAMFLSLAAVGLMAHSSSMSNMFSFGHHCSIYELPVWLSAGVALFLASIVDLSRMPVDDPTTHLELTMVHEAMILENSGKNLALVEFSHALKLVVLYGLSAQCLLHAITIAVPLTSTAVGILNVIGIVTMGLVTAIIESVSVKLQWRRTPEFIAYALTMSLFAAAGALIGGLYASHAL